MSKFEIIMPKLGESIIEATITKWLKSKGEKIEEDDPIVEIATDKVDSEIPSPVAGILDKILFKEGDTVEVGNVIAIIETNVEFSLEANENINVKKSHTEVKKQIEPNKINQPKSIDSKSKKYQSDRFYSPLVKNIAKKENLSTQELEMIQGSGKNGRVTKIDIVNYLGNKEIQNKLHQEKTLITSGGDQIVEMDRMRKLIADHMIMSKKVSAHVTSFIDVDVTNIVNWRNKIKDTFLKREEQKLTYTPIFIEAAAKALKYFPKINASVDGTKIILRKNINIGMATALPEGNLIVPVILNADQKNLLGISKEVNDLAHRARSNKLLPDEIQGGTFTITNFGSFDNLTGTPIINQPQVAILGIGAIRKKPVVIESEKGDVIAIRHMMILSLTYDHRIVDGALGGMYLKRLKEIMESFDSNHHIF